MSGTVEEDDTTGKSTDKSEDYASSYMGLSAAGAKKGVTIVSPTEGARADSNS